MNDTTEDSAESTPKGENGLPSPSNFPRMIDSLRSIAVSIFRSPKTTVALALLFVGSVIGWHYDLRPTDTVWGPVASWVGGLATAAGLVFTALEIRTSGRQRAADDQRYRDELRIQQERLAAERDDRLSERREREISQARNVIATLTDGDVDSHLYVNFVPFYVRVMNLSDGVITMVKITVPDSETGAFSLGDDPDEFDGSTSEPIRLLQPKSERTLNYRVHNSLSTEKFSAQDLVDDSFDADKLLIEFTDAAGIRWSRRGTSEPRRV